MRLSKAGKQPNGTISARGRGRKGSDAYGNDKTIRTLCPDPDTLNSHFAATLHILDSHEYRAKSMRENLPHWLDFLAKVGLVEEVAARDILASLSPLLEKVADLLGEQIPASGHHGEEMISAPPQPAV